MLRTVIRSHRACLVGGLNLNRTRPMGVAVRFNSSSTSNAAAAAEATTNASGAASEIKSEIASMASQSPTAAETVTEIASTVSPDQIGYFQSLGLAQNWYWPPDVFQHVFEYAHIYTGLPWWATIGIVTLGMRLVMLPMYYKASDTTAKFGKLQPEMQKILEDYQQTKDPLEGQKALLRRKKLMAEHNIKYRWMMAPLFGAPFFIGIFAGLNRMSAAPVEGFLTQGLAWFSNLSVADPYLGLQVITALIYSGTFKLGGEMGGTPSASAMKKIMPFLPFIAIPLTMKIPAATCLYFAFNGILSFFQAMAFQSNSLRAKIGLSPMVKPTPQEKAANQEGPIDSIKTLMRNMNEKAQEQARKTKEELEQKRQYELQQQQLDQRKYIQIDESAPAAKKNKAAPQSPPSAAAAGNKGKRVRKGKEMRM